ncbi:GcrA family cell cycle regulator [Fulvimarina sp. 2208YS6-2-32]|uniref:GcrA family cell cycle regulator n=1 Tax=Fulvimarina uroteuthidis TaxID=3098149 RepID=A0ABU5HZX1_9HYPH|nr:GcrA family cell cycle regulator [Fulvimarina sp. 2208YS6-2-32]MDY8108679.1 GcrA family cell cycle regulator [Fulvimarina sp. 2208YS6-2-32]
MSWTDERVSTLRQLWTDGHSASQIADRLGGVTRNAVIGKAHRLKLESRGKSANGAGEAEEAEIAPAAEAIEPEPQAPRVEIADETVVTGRFAATGAASMASSARPQSFGATALKMEPDEDVEYEIEVQSTTDAITGEIVPIARKLTLVQLTERTCKWPVGDPMHDDFHFCGNPSRDASPYCEFHAKLAFQAVERRRAR